jgi:hypothetical protein
MSAGTSPSGVGDAGLQAERTRLAWRRTTLAATAVAVLAASRLVVAGVQPAPLAATCAIALSWLALLITADRRIRALTGVRLHASAPTAAPATLGLLAAVIAAWGVLLV